MRFDAVINKFMFEANYYNQITVNGTGNQHRAFIHVKDIVHAICKILVTSEISGGTYNIAGKNLSINMISEQLQSLYPSLDIVYVNHHVSLREIQVDLESSTLSREVTKRQLDLKTELSDFQKEFSFKK